MPYDESETLNYTVSFFHVRTFCVTKIKCIKPYTRMTQNGKDVTTAAVTIPPICNFPLMSVNGFPPSSVHYRHSYHIRISQTISAYFEDKHGLAFINSPKRVATFCGKALLNTTLQLIIPVPVMDTPNLMSRNHSTFKTYKNC